MLALAKVRASIEILRLTKITAPQAIFKEILHQAKKLVNFSTSNVTLISNNNLHISISHTGDYIALIISKYDCGIDIQIYTDKISGAPQITGLQLKDCIVGDTGWVWAECTINGQTIPTAKARLLVE